LVSKNRKINYIAVNPTDIKANIQRGSHDPNHLFMAEEEKSFSAPSDFEKKKDSAWGKKSQQLTKSH